MIITYKNKKENLIDRHLLDSYERLQNNKWEELKTVSELISLIDLYQDTYIGEHQKDIYINEFKKLAEANLSEDIKKFSLKVIELLENLTPHEYLVFVGD